MTIMMKNPDLAERLRELWSEAEDAYTAGHPDRAIGKILTILDYLIGEHEAKP